MSKWLVLGATGFIGRNLVKHLIDIGDSVVSVDKVLPSTAFMSPLEEKLFEEKGNFVQKNLYNAVAVESLFEGKTYDYVVNLAAETKYGHNDEVYEERVYMLAMVAAKAAASHNVKKFIEVSTAQVYDATKDMKKENGKLAPWTKIAEKKLKVEKDLATIAGLNWVVLRPAIVYGPGDRYGIAPRIICGAIYKSEKKKMKFLWSADLRMNTVHVLDVCRAIVHAANKITPKTTWNLADKGDTNQGSINDNLSTLFGIETGFFGAIKSNLAQALGQEGLARRVNEEHVAPWAAMCKQQNIQFTPLSPYLDAELLSSKPLAIDGSAIESTGFTYQIPKMEVSHLNEWVTYNVDSKLFPGGYNVKLL